MPLRISGDVPHRTRICWRRSAPHSLAPPSASFPQLALAGPTGPALPGRRQPPDSSQHRLWSEI